MAKLWWSIWKNKCFLSKGSSSSPLMPGAPVIVVKRLWICEAECILALHVFFMLMWSCFLTWSTNCSPAVQLAPSCGFTWLLTITPNNSYCVSFLWYWWRLIILVLPFVSDTFSSSLNDSVSTHVLFAPTSSLLFIPILQTFDSKFSSFPF